MPPLRNRLVNPFVRALARTPAYRLLGRHLVVLRYTGRRSGRCYELPVMSAETGEDLVVVSGQHDSKTWWRNFAAAPRTVTVRRSGRIERRSARRLSPADAGYAEAVRAYRRQFPHVEIDAATPVLVLARSTPAAPERFGPDVVAFPGAPGRSTPDGTTTNRVATRTARRRRGVARAGRRTRRPENGVPRP